MPGEQMLQALWRENRGKILLLCLLVLLLLAIQLGQSLWMDPALESSRITLRKTQAALRQAQLRVAAGGGAKITGIADDLDHFYQMMPARTGLGNFIGRLYSYAEDAGIDIDQISYAAKPVKDVGLLSYQLSFAVSGRYSQLKKFIYQLENSPSLLILQKIALDEARQKKKKVVNLQLQLQTFFLEGDQ